MQNKCFPRRPGHWGGLSLSSPQEEEEEEAGACGEGSPQEGDGGSASPSHENSDLNIPAPSFSTWPFACHRWGCPGGSLRISWEPGESRRNMRQDRTLIRCWMMHQCIWLWVKEVLWMVWWGPFYCPCVWLDFFVGYVICADVWLDVWWGNVVTTYEKCFL